MKQVFLSYARNDREQARRLYDALARSGRLKVWFDRVDLQPGIEWRPAIRKAIRESDHFIALLSTNSVEGRGVRHSELAQALEILREFPQGARWLFPVRLDECGFPHDDLAEIHCTDLFLGWDEGVARLVDAMAPPPASGEPLVDTGPGESVLDYEYRVGVVDLDEQLGDLGALLAELNRIQRFFRFVEARLDVPEAAFHDIEGNGHLDLARIPAGAFGDPAFQNADLVVSVTQDLLSFEEDGFRYWNYIGVPYGGDERFIFSSTAGLFAHAATAGVKFEMAVVHIVTSLLVGYFADWGFHEELRECPMDFTEDHATIAPGLAAARFCEECRAALGRNPSLLAAAEALVRWGRPA